MSAVLKHLENLLRFNTTRNMRFNNQVHEFRKRDRNVWFHVVPVLKQEIAQDAEQKAEAESDTKVEPEADVDPMPEERARAVSVAGKDADMVRLENLAAEKPDQAYVIDDNGTQMTMEEVFAEMQRVDQEAEIDAAGIGKATECILKNGGIQQ